MNNKLIKPSLALQNYLLGDTLPLQHENIAGTILAFTKKILHNPPSSLAVIREKDKNMYIKQEYDILSLILFLDFRTGRVERYAINSSNPNDINKGFDYKDDVMVFENKKYLVSNEGLHYKKDDISNHVPEKFKDLFSLGNLNDGKITKTIYYKFLLELVRDYLLYGNSYGDGNMATLRKITEPLSANDNIPISSGTGKLTDNLKVLINESLDYKVKDFISYQDKKYLNYKTLNQLNKAKSEKLTILVPLNCINNTLKLITETNGLKLVEVNRKDLPQIVKDLVRTLNIRDLNNVKSLCKKIKIFNYNIVRKLDRLQKI